MIICSLPYETCSQRFRYINDLGLDTKSEGLRVDMRAWIGEYLDDTEWHYNLCLGDIDFVFPTRGFAALFILEWIDKRSLMDDPPIPRPGGDIGVRR